MKSNERTNKSKRLAVILAVALLVMAWGGGAALGGTEIKESGPASAKGLVLLEMFGDETKCRELGEKLAAIEGVEVQSMEFCC